MEFVQRAGGRWSFEVAEMAQRQWRSWLGSGGPKGPPSAPPTIPPIIITPFVYQTPAPAIDPRITPLGPPIAPPPRCPVMMAAFA